MECEVLKNGPLGKKTWIQSPINASSESVNIQTITLASHLVKGKEDLARIGLFFPPLKPPHSYASECIIKFELQVIMFY